MSVDLRVGKGVRRIILLGRDATGQVQPTVLYEAARTKSKRKTKMLKPVESFVRRGADAVEACAASYASRHRNSNRKKRDGWMRDATDNASRAGRRGVKRLRLTRWMMM